MIWRLTYTSAARGPTGRSGFQFVAMSQGTPPDVTRAVTAYMAYRPPPGAPPAPGPDELADFPTALAYGREGPYAVLARCRYTGRDYSGRYGNFLGQAIVATPEEMAGLRPIEFWDSPVWDAHWWDARLRSSSPEDSGLWDAPLGGSSPGDVPGDGAPSWDPSAGLPPGAAFDPESLAGRLGGDRSHDRLAAVLDAVATVLVAGHGRVVLAAEDVELIARWIAVVSYSLPAELAAGLSFTTYTADPEAAPYLVVGTVPAACPEGGFRLDGPFVRTGAPPGRFAQVIADCWRSRDLDGIDAVGELIGGADGSGAVSPPESGATRVPGGAHRANRSGGEDERARSGGSGGVSRLDGAAALLALCRGDTSVSAEEQVVAARLVRDRGVPGWVRSAGPWEQQRKQAGMRPGDRLDPGGRLPPALPVLGYDLAAALAEIVPEAAEHCVRLALADPGVRRRLPAVRLRDGLPEDFRAALAGAPDLRALAEVVGLADRVGGAVDGDRVIAAAAACARRGAGEVAAAVRAAPAAWREAVIAGIVTGLESAPPEVRRAMLTPEACAALGDRDWTRAPRTGGLVLSARADRLTATAELIALEAHGLPDIEDLLGVLWSEAPTVPECRWLAERLGPPLPRFAVLRALPRRVFDAVPLDAEETLRLARLIDDRLPGLADAARTVLAYGDALRAGSEEEIARFLAASRPGGPLDERVLAGVARMLAGRSPLSRVRVLIATPDAVRDALIRHWLAAGPDRHGRADLAEIGVRLADANIPATLLEEWADGLGRFDRRRIESALADRDPRLAAAWRGSRRRGA
ncbi:hypothetical protein NE236_08490 [Actinoallomurus purpureus]|uniref:GAP1-N2 domain-containing protein n=1 Tax=Actinoallomurus purpureus TaxID=478114 RepID=UPI002093E628|nr:hypothetical protein [Actinoallomurus purpureus]MCO6005018.1 hypothetical protein [Actinoallomurus purpureus]